MAPLRPIHPLPVRLAHGVNAFAMVCMLMSGWAIYNASPIFAFSFPGWATVGGWLGGSIAWHFASMWLLVVNGLIYAGYGFASGHFRRVLLPIRKDELIRDLRQAARFELPHRLGVYNAVATFALHRDAAARRSHRCLGAVDLEASAVVLADRVLRRL